MSDARIEFEHNGLARCGSCGEPTCPVLIGTPAEVEANPNIVIRCIACAASDEAEQITGEAVGRPTWRSGPELRTRINEAVERDREASMYDLSTVTFAERARCFVTGHDVHEWGTLLGWCHRCKHRVWTSNRRTVLSYGRDYAFPPRHQEAKS